MVGSAVCWAFGFDGYIRADVGVVMVGERNDESGQRWVKVSVRGLAWPSCSSFWLQLLVCTLAFCLWVWDVFL